jgi:hypothetical protein
MTNNDDVTVDVNESVPTPIPDPARLLESIVSEYEYLSQDAPLGSGFDLVELHGALLVYNLGADVALLPSPAFGLSARSWRERRIVHAARRILAVGAGDQARTMDIAADLVDRHLHLIDPELRNLAA